LNLCPDTNVAIELVRRGRPHFRLRMAEAEAAGARLFLSPIVLHELVFGAQKSARPEHQLALVMSFATALEPQPWSSDDAAEAAVIRAELGGQSIGMMDTLIAGQARSRGWTLVTANLREFTRVADLHVVDWSDPAGPVDHGRATASLPRPPKD